MNRIFKLVLALCSLLFIHPAFTCNDIQVKTKDDILIVNRTIEFDPDMQSRLMNSPRGKKCQQQLRIIDPRSSGLYIKI